MLGYVEFHNFLEGMAVASKHSSVNPSDIINVMYIFLKYVRVCRIS